MNFFMNMLGNGKNWKIKKLVKMINLSNKSCGKASQLPQLLSFPKKYTLTLEIQILYHLNVPLNM